PELRELAAKIRQRINGQALLAQIQYKAAQRKEEVEREQELDRLLMEADRLADIEETRKNRLREQRNNDELRQFLSEKDDIRNAKLAAIMADKADSKRIVDELVQEEARLTNE
ncbi:hypothetical protein FBUS_03791, partial [Fasciolopsis buskii]